MTCQNRIKINVNKIEREVACSKCLACRINKRQEWVGRILLEARLHQYVYFLTLTYDDSFYNNTVVKRDLQLFIKRLRKRVGFDILRYFAVGEYGTRTDRGHYHLILFSKKEVKEEDILKTWRYGFVKFESVKRTGDGKDINKVANYVASYLLKLKEEEEEEEEEGREKEFRLSSRRDGIGKEGLRSIVMGLQLQGITVQQALTDVHVFRLYNKFYRFGSYLKQHLLEMLDESYARVMKLRRQKQAYFRKFFLREYKKVYSIDFYSSSFRLVGDSVAKSLEIAKRDIRREWMEILERVKSNDYFHELIELRRNYKYEYRELSLEEREQQKRICDNIFFKFERARVVF